MTSQRGMMDTSDHGKMCGCHKCAKCISWSAIFVGAFVGLGVGFLLNLFAIAIGLVAYKNAADGSAAFAVGGYIGLVIIAFVTYFFAGWAAGHLGFAHCPKDRGLFYGFTTWVVSGVLAMLLAGHMGHYATYRTSQLSNPSAVFVVTDSAPTADATTAAATPTTTAASTNTMMTVAFASFFLFLIAALSSIFGAHCAFKCRYKEEHL